MRQRTVLWILPLLTLLGGCGYNQIQRYDENAQQAKQQISVQLQRRADLVPNLVNTVKGFAAQEKEVLLGRFWSCFKRSSPSGKTSRPSERLKSRERFKANWA